MILPDLTVRTKHTKLEEGIVVYSTVTDIYYKVVKDTLMRYSNYGGADRQWVKSGYSKGFKHMRKATPQEIKGLK